MAKSTAATGALDYEYKGADVEINECQTRVHEIAKSKGWWEGVKGLEEHDMDAVLIAAKLALVHAELSEALEEVRAGSPMFYYAPDGSGKPEGLSVELADAIIRILDLSAALGIDMEETLQRKMKYNDTRPHRHGGKAL